jgi:hypothetical protein
LPKSPELPKLKTNTFETQRNGGRGGERAFAADLRGLTRIGKGHNLPLINTDDTDLKRLPKSPELPKLKTNTFETQRNGGRGRAEKGSPTSICAPPWFPVNLSLTNTRAFEAQFQN